MGDWQAKPTSSEVICITYSNIRWFIFGIIIALLFIFCLTKPVTAKAPAPDAEDYTSGSLVIKDNAIQRPIENISANSNSKTKGFNDVRQTQTSGRHSTRAEKRADTEKLRLYLEQRGSPLSAYAAWLAQSPYYSTIIGICTIEQYGCTHALYNNYWGIMCKGQLCRFSDLHAGIEAIDTLLAKYEGNGHDTIESLNGYYVQPASSNWLQTVLKTKQLIENL